MTKLNLLLNTYSHARVRDSWKNTGSLQITNTVRYITEDSIFQNNQSGSPLLGAIFYCDTELTLDTSFNWINYVIADRASGTIMDQHSIVHPHIYIVLTQPELAGIITATSVFSVNSVAGATMGTLSWTGGASGAITLTTPDIVSTTTVALKIAATGASGGWTVTSLNNIVTMTSVLTTPPAMPGIALGSATNITFSSFTYVTGNLYDSSFIPFQEQSILDPIDIPQDEFDKIMLESGVPFIDINELEYSRTDIMRLCIKPAMVEFFKWFPIITLQRYGLSDATFSIPIPNWAYGAGRVFVNPGYPISNAVQNPLLFFFDETLLSISNQGGLSVPNLNSTKRRGFVDTQNYSTFVMERAARQGIVNYSTRTRVRVQIQQGNIVGYTTKRGVLEVEWTSNSTDWDDIPQNFWSQVRDLAKAYVMRALAMLRMQNRADIPGTLDYTRFLERAEKLEEATLELWKSSTKPTIVRV